MCYTDFRVLDFRGIVSTIFIDRSIGMIMGDLFFGLLLAANVAFSVTSCKPIRKRSAASEALETGKISEEDLGVFPITFQPRDIRFGVFKICGIKVFIECGTGFLIDRDGIVISTAHGNQRFFGDYQTYSPKVKTPVDFEGLNSLYFISAINSDDLGRPVEPKKFKAALLMRGSHRNQGTDISFYRLEEFNSEEEHAFPLQTNSSFTGNSDDGIEKNLRVFVAGFPWPNIYPSYLEKARLAASEIEDSKDFERRQFDFDLAFTTGIIQLENVKTSYIKGTDLTENKYETSTYSSMAGMSGAPILDKDGIVLGVHTSGLRTSRRLGESDNSVSSYVRGVPIGNISKEFDLSTFNLLNGTAGRGQETLARVKHIGKANEKLRKEAAELQTYLKDSVSILRKLRRTKSRFKLKSPLYCEVLMDTVNEEDQSKKDDWMVSIAEFEIDIINFRDSRIRYRSNDRSDRDKFYKLWLSNGWSPWFAVNTEDILSEMKTITVADYSAFGKKLRGFGPFIANPKLIEDSSIGKWYRSEERENISILAGMFWALVAGKYPMGKEVSTKTKELWTVSFCNG